MLSAAFTILNPDWFADVGTEDDHVWTCEFVLNVCIFFLFKTCIKVFDVTGREIDQIVNGIQDPSNYTEIWNASKFEKGLYTIELYINGVKSITDRVVVQ